MRFWVENRNIGSFGAHKGAYTLYICIHIHIWTDWGSKSLRLGWQFIAPPPPPSTYPFGHMLHECKYWNNLRKSARNSLTGRLVVWTSRRPNKSHEKEHWTQYVRTTGRIRNLFENGIGKQKCHSSCPVRTKELNFYTHFFFVPFAYQSGTRARARVSGKNMQNLQLSRIYGYLCCTLNAIELALNKWHGAQFDSDSPSCTPFRRWNSRCLHFALPSNVHSHSPSFLCFWLSFKTF